MLNYLGCWVVIFVTENDNQEAFEYDFAALDLS